MREFPKFQLLDVPRAREAFELHKRHVISHFAESRDAITLCRLSAAGQRKFLAYEDKAEIYNEHAIARYMPAAKPYWTIRDNIETPCWQPCPGIAINLRFARLFAESSKLYECYRGRHQPGTVISTIARDTTVVPGTTQRTAVLHCDAYAWELEQGHEYTVLDFISQPELAPTYIKGYKGPSDPLHGFLVRHAQYSQHRHGRDRIKKMQASADYREAMAMAQPRFWKPSGMSLVARTNLTPHFGAINETALPIRRPFALQMFQHLKS